MIDPLALAFPTPAIRKRREGRGTHCVGDASEIKSLGYLPRFHRNSTLVPSTLVPSMTLGESAFLSYPSIKEWCGVAAAGLPIFGSGAARNAMADQDGKTNEINANESPRMAKKPYQEPAFRHEKVFETMALSCGKVQTTQSGCHFNKHSS